MIVVLLIVIVLMLGDIGSNVKRAARHLRRLPCVACGHPLLPAARACPNCFSVQPLRGWARLERLWKP
jgi:uncharacterized OB-fold protein